uniref:Uncharacterized protein n=1 Tax=Palpitomonas bilix TaxID=652834 RepID=A0A7S3G853_9EUKA
MPKPKFVAFTSTLTDLCDSCMPANTLKPMLNPLAISPPAPTVLYPSVSVQPSASAPDIPMPVLIVKVPCNLPSLMSTPISRTTSATIVGIMLGKKLRKKERWQVAKEKKAKNEGRGSQKREETGLRR